MELQSQKNTTTFCLFILLLLMAPFHSLQAQSSTFEGVIHYKIPNDVSGSGNMQDFLYMVKDKRVRMEIKTSGPQKAIMLFNRGDNEVIVLVNQAKAYMKMPLTHDSQDQSSSDEPEASFEQTGQTKTIAGRTCELWKTTDNDKTIEMWVAPNMGTFMMPNASPSGYSEGQQEWMKKIQDGNFMPLEVDVIKNGESRQVLKADKIEEKSLADQLFTIPDGYRDMSGMMKMMRNKQ